MTIAIRTFTTADIAAAFAIWTGAEGLGDAPSQAMLERFLRSNPGLSQVAEIDGVMVGCLLASFDGIRGYLYRLAVARPQRRHGVAKALVEAAVAALREAGADRCNLHIYADNAQARAFWATAGWAHAPHLEFWTRRW